MLKQDKTFDLIKSEVESKINRQSIYPYIDTSKEKVLVLSECNVYFKVVELRTISDFLIKLPNCEFYDMTSFYKYLVPKTNFVIENKLTQKNIHRTKYLLNLQNALSILIKDYFDDGFIYAFKYFNPSDKNDPGSWVLCYIQKKSVQPKSFKDIYYEY